VTWTFGEKEQVRPEYFCPHVIGDLGYVDLTVIAYGYYDFQNDYDVIEQELVMRRSRSDEINAASKTIEKQLWGERAVWKRRMDAMPITLADMSEPGREWIAPRKDEKLAAINAFRLRIRRNRFRVHPRCTTIISHCKYGRWNRNRTDFERPSDRAHHYDGLACAIYFARHLDRQENPFPAADLVALRQEHHVSHVAAPREGIERLMPRRRYR